MTVNKVILVGNLGADPEVRTTQGGMSIANLRIATSERRKDKDGNWSDHTEWHRVTCFGKMAENAQKFLKKGKQVYIEGALRTTKYADKKTGEDRYSTEVTCNDLRFLGGKEGGADRASGSGGYGGGSGNAGGGYGEERNHGGSGPYGGGTGGDGGKGADDDIPW
jgi:single-strand DNA-binding protein